jgi:pimeloyl-[acyl-carrier protein] methyl ester esterase
MTLYVEKIGTGPPLTMLHGWGLNGAVWNTLHDVLAAHFTLHIVDLPGHGFSSYVTAGTIAEMAEHVAAVLPPRTHLLGWSLGGQVTLEIARRFPAQIDKLILVSTTPRFVVAEDWPHGKKIAALDDFAKRLGQDYDGTIRNFLALQVLHQTHARKTIADLQRAVSARGAPNLANLTAGLNMLRASDLRRDLNAITAPTLVIQGDHDALTAESAGAWLAANMPNAQYAKIDRAAHAPFLSHPALFRQHLETFLQP